MAYANANGEKKYTLKEKIAYHKKCANSGKGKDGETLKPAQRVNHALAADRCRKKLNKYMKVYNSVNRNKK